MVQLEQARRVDAPKTAQGQINPEDNPEPRHEGVVCSDHCRHPRGPHARKRKRDNRKKRSTSQKREERRRGRRKAKKKRLDIAAKRTAAATLQLNCGNVPKKCGAISNKMPSVLNFGTCPQFSRRAAAAVLLAAMSCLFFLAFLLRLFLSSLFRLVLLFFRFSFFLFQHPQTLHRSQHGPSQGRNQFSSAILLPAHLALCRLQFPRLYSAMPLIHRS